MSQVFIEHPEETAAKQVASQESGRKAAQIPAGR
jgi:hypothetical protein